MAYDAESKAAAMAALLAGQGVNDVARQYDIPKATVSRWNEGLSKTEQNGTQKRVEFGDLIAKYLEQNLTTLAAQQEHFRDKDWLKRQPADSLAVLHGVSADKAIRILEAVERAGGSTSPSTG